MLATIVDEALGKCYRLLMDFSMYRIERFAREPEADRSDRIIPKKLEDDKMDFGGP